MWAERRIRKVKASGAKIISKFHSFHIASKKYATVRYSTLHKVCTYFPNTTQEAQIPVTHVPSLADILPKILLVMHYLIF